MKITGLESSDEILHEMGSRIRDARIAADITQVELAREAGVAKKTLSNLEQGRDVSLRSLLKVLRSLDMLANVEYLVPGQEIRPSDLEKLGERRRRVRKSRKKEPERTWVWGEDE